MDDIANAVAVGKTVTTAGRDLTYGAFTGVGYVLQDPQTGEAAYLIDGGASGGEQTGCGTMIDPLEALFASFDAEPVASASIAQVHFATLKDGREVAVKVLRPGMLDVIDDDATWEPGAIADLRALYAWAPPVPPEFILPNDIAARAAEA